MKNLILTSTSYINPGNKSWEILKKKYKLSFSEYGDWITSLSKKNSNCAISFILFFDDVLSQVNNETEAKIKIKFDIIFQAIIDRCENSDQPTLICLSGPEPSNVINDAKNVSKSRLVYFWIIKKMNLLIKKFSTLYFIDLDNQFSLTGRNKNFDHRNWYFARSRNTPEGLKVISDSIYKILNRINKPASKVLVLDCDNTIWGGIIGEDGIEGIKLGSDGAGKVFVDFQKEIKKLANNGILLALSSKNNENDVWDVFKKHKSMILKKKDIVSWRINWKEKSQNILDISRELDLNIDSFVFWDDNPVERDKAKLMLPNMQTIDVPIDIYKWPSAIKNLDLLSKFVTTKEDKKKTKQYKSRAHFVRNIKEAKNVNYYLKSIKLKPSSFYLSVDNINRAAQMCEKTNQFNLRTIRHRVEDLKKISKFNKDFCKITSLKDIYGDHGLVGLFCLKKINNKTLFLDTFLMSCRVIGRHYESWMLKEAINISKKNNFSFLLAEYIPTQKNIIAKNFLKEHGFKEIQKFKNLSNTIRINGNLSKKTLIIDTKTKKIPFTEIYENYRK